jgi:hypothetical protein
MTGVPKSTMTATAAAVLQNRGVARIGQGAGVESCATRWKRNKLPAPSWSCGPDRLADAPSCVRRRGWQIIMSLCVHCGVHDDLGDQNDRLGDCVRREVGAGLKMASLSLTLSETLIGAAIHGIREWVSVPERGALVAPAPHEKRRYATAPRPTLVAMLAKTRRSRSLDRTQAYRSAEGGQIQPVQKVPVSDADAPSDRRLLLRGLVHSDLTHKITRPLSRL